MTFLKALLPFLIGLALATPLALILRSSMNAIPALPGTSPNNDPLVTGVFVLLFILGFALTHLALRRWTD